MNNNQLAPMCEDYHNAREFGELCARLHFFGGTAVSACFDACRNAPSKNDSMTYAVAEWIEGFSDCLDGNKCDSGYGEFYQKGYATSYTLEAQAEGRDNYAS